MPLPNEQVTEAARLGAEAYMRNATNANALSAGCTPNANPESIFVIAACMQVRLEGSVGGALVILTGVLARTHGINWESGRHAPGVLGPLSLFIPCTCMHDEQRCC